jgi:two-component system nitrogen regulation response regulator GlnG
MSIERILVADDEESIRLVADDEESIRWVLSKSLTKQGYQVDLAKDGKEALLMSRRQSYDLAVLDIKMPGITGLELLNVPKR